MGIGESKSSKASKIIVISTIGVLIIAGLTINFMAQEPVSKSLVIKLSTLDGKATAEGAVTEGGVGDELKATYILNILNDAPTGGRNVTLKYNWTTELPDWDVSFDPEYIIVGSKDVEQVTVTVEAPLGVAFGQKTVIKVYAWEYLDIAEPTLDLWNTTKDVDGGEVIITTDVAKAIAVDPPGPQPGEPSRQTGFAGETQSFNGLVTYAGTLPGRVELDAETSGSTRAPIWLNSITFYPSDLSPILSYNQDWPFRMDVDVPLDAEAGTYFITVTAAAKTFSNTFTYTIDVPEPDLFVEELSFSHLTILDGGEMTISVKTGNRGSRVVDTFGVEVSAKNPDGGWEVIGLENVTTGLKYGKTKTVSFNYNVKNTGLLTIRARVDPNNDIQESDNGNNIVEDNIEVVETDSVTPSFFIHIILIVSSVAIVTLMSRKKK